MVRTLSTSESGIHVEHLHQAAPAADRPLPREPRVIAICAATIARPTRWLRPASPPVHARLPRGLLLGSPDVARIAVNAPRPAATAVERRNANASTGTLSATLSSRGRLAGASAISSGHAEQRSHHAEAPPTSESSDGLREELTRSAARARRPARREWRAPALVADAWASSRLATFAHATSSRKPDRPQQQRAAPGERLAGDRILERHHQSVLEEIVALLARRVVNAPRDRADVLVRLPDRYAVAKARDRASSCATSWIGFSPSRSAGSHRSTPAGKRNPGGSTPITEKTDPPIFRCARERSAAEPSYCFQ